MQLIYMIYFIALEWMHFSKLKNSDVTSQITAVKTLNEIIWKLHFSNWMH